MITRDHSLLFPLAARLGVLGEEYRPHPCPEYRDLCSRETDTDLSVRFLKITLVLPDEEEELG